MGEKTEISWCDHTFNSWWGCTKVSPACDRCYAETWSKRTGLSIWGKDSDRRFFSEKHWEEPLKWNRAAEKSGTRKRVFCGSMCDIMEDRRDLDVWRQRTYSLIEETPNLDWLLLTKRPQNFRRFFPALWLDQPRPNVWIMTSVESPEYLWRIDSLKGCPAVVHGLSIEPLLAPLPMLGEYLDGIEWTIVGGESGHGARPFDLEWARDARDQCKAAGVAYFFKQAGANVFDSSLTASGKSESLKFADRKGGDMSEWPEDLRIREFPKITVDSQVPESKN